MSKTYQLNGCLPFWFTSNYLPFGEINIVVVWTTREFQTVGAVAQNALAANDIVASCCCGRRAGVERKVLDGW